MTQYIHQLKQWPRFAWDSKQLEGQLANVHHLQKMLRDRMESMGFRLREEALLQTLTEDVLKSSEIEGEILSKKQVRSSVARRLGMDIGALPAVDRHVEGIVAMMLDATQKFNTPLTQQRLFGWHAALFPTGQSGLSKIIVGNWRKDASDPMQVVSGPFGRERVHYEAPVAPRLEKEMQAFFEWFNTPNDNDPILNAAIAHLWFVTIHPFEDGNGRIARAIADMVLARSEKSAQRFYSMSAQIREDRNDYYDFLEKTQKGSLDITQWLSWFINCLGRALVNTETVLTKTFQKARFWAQHTGKSLNDRQRDIINRLLDGFEGKLTSSKWATLAKCSPDTALRDIDDLIKRGILIKDAAGGCSTSYSLIGSPAAALPAIGAYTQLHSDKTSPSPMRIRSNEEKKKQQRQIEILAEKMIALADKSAKGEVVLYQEFEVILRELHKNGFTPDDELVSTIAFALQDTY